MKSKNGTSKVATHATAAFHPSPEEVRRYLENIEPDRKAWLERQKHDPRNVAQKAKIVEAVDALQHKRFAENPKLLRPGDGTWFSYPSGEGKRVVACIEALLESHVRRAPEDARTLFDLSVEAIVARSESDLALLETLVQAGDEHAVIGYARLTHQMVGTLNRHAEQQPDAFRSAAANLPNWPVLKGTRPKNNKWTSIPKLLGVGNAVTFTDEMVSLLEGRDSKRVMLTAVRLGQRIEHWRTRDGAMLYFYERMTPPTSAEAKSKELKPFSSETWTDWFQNAWAILMEENNGHPEKNSQLRPMGQSRASHSKHTGAQTTVTERTRESNIRDRIKERLSGSFKSIAESMAGGFPKKMSKSRGK